MDLCHLYGNYAFLQQNQKNPHTYLTGQGLKTIKAQSWYIS